MTIIDFEALLYDGDFWVSWARTKYHFFSQSLKGGWQFSASFSAKVLVVIAHATPLPANFRGQETIFAMAPPRHVGIFRPPYS